MNYKVSIVVLTYFHEKWIRQALDSILEQDVDFQYEIIIADDCSTDKTRRIVQEYKNKYPDKFKLLFNDTNIGIPANIYNAFRQCRGEYITLLSGDDFWIGKDSLQKKVAFYDKHQEYSAICTQVERRLDGKYFDSYMIPTKYLNNEINLKMYLKGVPFPTHGMVFRNFNFDGEEEYFSLIKKCSEYIDDSTMCILLLRKAPVYALGISAYAYRVPISKKNGHSYNSRNTLFEKGKKETELYNNLSKYVSDVDLIQPYIRCYSLAIIGGILSRQLYQLKELYYTIDASYRNRFFLSRCFAQCFIIGYRGVLSRIRKKIANVRSSK